MDSEDSGVQTEISTDLSSGYSDGTFCCRRDLQTDKRGGTDRHRGRTASDVGGTVL